MTYSELISKLRTLLTKPMTKAKRQQKYSELRREFRSIGTEINKSFLAALALAGNNYYQLLRLEQDIKNHINGSNLTEKQQHRKDVAGKHLSDAKQISDKQLSDKLAQLRKIRGKQKLAFYRYQNIQARINQLSDVEEYILPYFFWEKEHTENHIRNNTICLHGKKRIVRKFAKMQHKTYSEFITVNQEAKLKHELMKTNGRIYLSELVQDTEQNIADNEAIERAVKLIAKVRA